MWYIPGRSHRAAGKQRHFQFGFLPISLLCVVTFAWGISTRPVQAAQTPPLIPALESSNEISPAPAPAPGNQTDNSTQPNAAKKEFSVVRFRVAAPSGERVTGARVIVLDPGGDVISSGLTDASGDWNAPIPVAVDGRFASVRRMGTVTAIVVANGFNEQVVFVIPVVPHAVEPVILNPIDRGARNEPTAKLGNLHRHDVQVLVDMYAKKLGLQRQTAIPGELGYAPWGPQQEARMTDAKHAHPARHAQHAHTQGGSR